MLRRIRVHENSGFPIGSKRQHPEIASRLGIQIGIEQEATIPRPDLRPLELWRFQEQLFASRALVGTSCSSLFDLNTTRVPSGDQTGSESERKPNVSRVDTPRVNSITQRSFSKLQ